MRGGQTWSIDIVIGFLIFLLVIGVFYALLTSNAREDTTDLKISSETVAEKLSSQSENGILTNDAVDYEKLVALATKNYQSLRQEMGVNTEFCVFFEDENGNVVNITFEDGGVEKTYIGIGSSKINISGIPCHEVS